MSLKAIVILFFICLTGCASSPMYNLDMSVSELSDSIQSSSSSSVSVEPEYRSSFAGAHIESAGNVNATGGFDDNEFTMFTNSHVVISRHVTLDSATQPYKLNDGYEISFAGSTGREMIRGALHISEADFQTSKTDGFHNPYFFSIDVGVYRLFPSEPFNLLAGIRGTYGVLTYDFNKPLSIGQEKFTYDSIKVLGIGLPVGVQMDVGHLTLEAIVAPTVYLHDFKTAIGFDNDLGFADVKVPMTVGVGYNW